MKKLILSEEVEFNPLIKTLNYLLKHKNLGRNQTVMMPYSSKLRDLSFWFVQLWAESLGKKNSLSNEIVKTGFTPIPSYGATDQHSQVQLFMEGPEDKVIIVLEVKKFKHDYSLESSLNIKSLKSLKSYTMSELLSAECHGTLMALKDQERPSIHIQISENNEVNMGSLILFFQSLTAIMGYALNINPFDQPGVEAGKAYALKGLEQQSE